MAFLIGPYKSFLTRQPAAVAAPPGVAWSTPHADVTRSSLTLTLTGAGGAYRTTLADTAIVDGTQKYFEIAIAVRGSTAFVVGAGLSSQSQTAYVGSSTGLGWAAGGSVYRTGSLVTTDSSYSAVTILVAVDRVNDKVWWYSTASGWRGSSGADDPTTNTGGLDISSITADLYPAVSMFTTNDQVTGNFGGSSFTHTTQVSALQGVGFSAMQ